MTAAWTIEDAAGQLRPEFTAASPLEVGRRILPGRYDAFRLIVAPSYRQLFDRAVAKLLAEQGWRIVKLPARTRWPDRSDDLALVA
jgi:hypothetical protein